MADALRVHYPTRSGILVADYGNVVYVDCENAV
jgi:hypothetical protein